MTLYVIEQLRKTEKPCKPRRFVCDHPQFGRERNDSIATSGCLKNVLLHDDPDLAGVYATICCRLIAQQFRVVEVELEIKGEVAS